MKDVRTWVEIDANALRHNAEQFLRIVPAHTRLMAVIKSNAYGHGLSLVAKGLAECCHPRPASKCGINSSGNPEQEINWIPDQVGNDRNKNKVADTRLWFGVDSIVEALRLRHEGIRNKILVLGYTLPLRIVEAAGRDIILTISNFDALRAFAAAKARPTFHLKIDTGMHRQGFMPDEIPKLIAVLKRKNLTPAGIYTHFASAKDPHDRAYTLMQAKKFEDVRSRFRQSGFRRLVCHAAASGGALLFPEAHLDMARVGMGIYGYWPSQETKVMRSFPATVKGTKFKSLNLRPVLTWKSIVAEVKEVPRGAKIGYDETETVERKSKIAVIPIGYWHGYDRGLSGTGEVLVRGKRVKVLGRVSMDMIVVDVTDIPRVRVGDEIVLIGKQGKDAILGDELAAKINTTAYEFLTRINPLIRRVAVGQ